MDINEFKPGDLYLMEWGLGPYQLGADGWGPYQLVGEYVRRLGLTAVFIPMCCNYSREDTDFVQFTFRACKATRVDDLFPYIHMQRKFPAFDKYFRS